MFNKTMCLNKANILSLLEYKNDVIFLDLGRDDGSWTLKVKVAEDGSSWHNIFAAVLGWQIFSLTNVSTIKCGIGNPLAIHRVENEIVSSWTHKTIFNYIGLKEIFEIHGFFKDVVIKGAGYSPFPAFFGLLDPLHSHFLTIKARKK